MSHEFLSLAQASEHVQVDANELKHVAQRGEIDAVIRSGEWYFAHSALDEWAQRNMLEGNAKTFARRDSADVETPRLRPLPWKPPPHAQ